MLSTTVTAPFSRPIFEIKAMSQTVMVGFAGVSRNIILVFFPSASPTASRSEVSTKLTSIPNLVRIEEKRPYVQP